MEKKFESTIYLENENVSNFCVKCEITFEIARLEEALEWYETDEDGLQKMFNCESFFEEFSERFHVLIKKCEYVEWE